MKVNRKKIIEAIEYIEKINNTKFDDLDWNDFPEYKKITPQEIENFKIIGLPNQCFFRDVLMGNWESISCVGVFK
jgi:hypothetical protein